MSYRSDGLPFSKLGPADSVNYGQVGLTQTANLIMPPPLIGGGIKRCFCLMFDVCLSRTPGVTREQRGLGRLKLA